MPHIVLENITSTKEAYDVIVPFVEKTDGYILKVTEKYLSSSGKSVLIESLAIGGGINQNFFIELSQKQNSLTVRLFPLTDPEKTPGVKKIMALVAKQIKDADPVIRYGKTNLQDFLIE